MQTHKTWAECEKRVKGAKGARFKKALSAIEEAQIMGDFKTTGTD
ncbi:MAG TPA: viroplasmin family protein [Candidatus Paceibacterota bacterium]